MVGAEDCAVNDRWECSVWIQVSAADAWNLNELQHRPVACQKHDADTGEDDRAIALPAFSYGKIEKPAERVADCDALKNSWKAERVPYIIRKSIDDQAEEKERNASTDDAKRGLTAGCIRLGTRTERKRDSQTDHEEEGGEDHVGCGGAIPLRMTELMPGVRVRARVCDQNHRSDHHAAKNIK